MTRNVDNTAKAKTTLKYNSIEDINNEKVSSNAYDSSPYNKVESIKNSKDLMKSKSNIITKTHRGFIEKLQDSQSVLKPNGFILSPVSQDRKTYETDFHSFHLNPQ